MTTSRVKLNRDASALVAFLATVCKTMAVMIRTSYSMHTIG